MPTPVEERRPPITPQLAVRVAVLGGFAFVLFAIVFFRLWFLQVLSGEDYVAKARENRVRKVRIEAPRGDIVDRNGRVLVKTRIAPVVQIVPGALPDAVITEADAYRKERGEAEKAGWPPPTSCTRSNATSASAGTARPRPAPRAPPAARAARQARAVPIPPLPADEVKLRRLYRRLGHVIRVKPNRIHERVIEGVAELPYSNVTIKTASTARPSTTSASARSSSRASRSRSSTCATTRTRSSPRSCSGRRARSRRGSSRRSATRASPPARGSAPTASRRATTSTCAARTATRGSSSTRSATATTAGG